jgi:glycosyltransferase involved in cell wall biosynthesis
MSAPAQRRPDRAAELAAADAVWDGTPTPTGPLDLIYVLPHHAVTGGMKVLLEHVRHLRARGHRVRAAYRGPEGRAIPAWSDVRCDGEIVNPPDTALGPRLGGADAVVVGWYQSIPECLGAAAPLVSFEQGHEVLFGDVREDEAWRRSARQFEEVMRLPVPVAAVSPHVAALLRARFGRRCAVWPNGIDLERFRPEPRPPGQRILLVGHPGLAFKGFRTAVEALERAWRAGARFEVTWMSQEPVTLDNAPFPFVNRVSPPQDEVPAIYRAHDLLLFTSWYEAFALPPLEAMASGVPVVATQCGGITTFATGGHDAVLCPVGDATALARAVLAVLADPDAARLLAERGRAAAERFSWERTIDAVEDGLRLVAAGRRSGRRA